MCMHGVFSGNFKKIFLLFCPALGCYYLPSFSKIYEEKLKYFRKFGSYAQ